MRERASEREGVGVKERAWRGVRGRVREREEKRRERVRERNRNREGASTFVW